MVINYLKKKYDYIVILLVLMLFSQQAMPVNQDTRPAELAYANEQLNKVYQKIIKEMSSVEREKLRKAQRAWLNLRDLDCEWAFSRKVDCLIERTGDRTKELSASIFSDHKGNFREIDYE